MQCIDSMRDTSQESSSRSPTEPPQELSHQEARDRRSRVVGFGRKHPAVTVAGLAGVGLLGGIELAAGVLLGAGVAALIRRPDGTPLTEYSGMWGRVRKMLERTPRDLRTVKERVRAVILAARGEIGVPPVETQDKPAQSPESGAPHAAPV
jgi:hypothetical protein